MNQLDRDFNTINKFSILLTFPNLLCFIFPQNEITVVNCQSCISFTFVLNFQTTTIDEIQNSLCRKIEFRQLKLNLLSLTIPLDLL